MFEKCDANCDAKLPHLWLRNDIFYYRVELDRVNGKRRYNMLLKGNNCKTEQIRKRNAIITARNFAIFNLK